jgi:peroxiredoxin Q/BCP
VSETSAIPKVGDKAPDFTLPSTEQRDISLSDYAGKKSVVLYFYPRDDTPGCTREACAFRDLRTVFNEAGAEILGVSTDDVAKHDKFRDKYGLNFPLLADKEKTLHSAYGTWGKKKFMGRESMGTLRTTFVIGPDGVIKAVFPKVTVDGHADEVLKAVKA